MVSIPGTDYDVTLDPEKADYGVTSRDDTGTGVSLGDTYSIGTGGTSYWDGSSYSWAGPSDADYGVTYDDDDGWGVGYGDHSVDSGYTTTDTDDGDDDGDGLGDMQLLVAVLSAAGVLLALLFGGGD